MEPEPRQVQALIRAGQLFHQRGWVPATGGNFSIRAGDDALAITVSGSHKGELTPADLMRVDLAGRSLDGRKSSAETLLHCQVYRRFAEARCVLHTHSVATTVLSRAGDRVKLKGYELLKILEGVTTHETTVELPVFENDQDMVRMSRRVDEFVHPDGAAHVYLIRGHGLYTWAPSVELARYRIEALEFMLECELNARR